MVAGIALPDQEMELIGELQAGSERAFDELLANYQEPIYNFVRRLLEDSADAPDVTQEVFLKVFRHIREFRGQSSLKTWIYRIAVNETSNLRRWFGRHRGRELSLDAGEMDGVAGIEAVDGQESPFDWVLRRERLRAVADALSELKECFRVAVVLRDIEGLSYEEIAEVLQVSLGTVKSRILRGREALKSGLQPLVAAPSPASCALTAVEERP